MKEEKHIRDLRTHLHKIFMTITMWDKDTTCIDVIRKRANDSKNFPKYLRTKKYPYKAYIDAIYLIDKYNIPEEIIKKIYYEEDNKRITFSKLHTYQKRIINRDNKSSINYGSWGSNVNKIRYPSKKRPLSTWKRFYKLFPKIAELDNFDGKTSDKMK